MKTKLSIGFNYLRSDIIFIGTKCNWNKLSVQSKSVEHDIKLGDNHLGLFNDTEMMWLRSTI